MTERPAVQVSTDDRRRWSSRSPIRYRHGGDTYDGLRDRATFSARVTLLACT